MLSSLCIDGAFLAAFPAFTWSSTYRPQIIISTMAKSSVGFQYRSEVDDLVPSIHVMSYQNAQSFLDAVGPWLRADEKAANTILPYAEMLATPSCGLPSVMLGQIQWVVCWGLSSPQPLPVEELARLPIDEVTQVCLTPQLRFVLMVAESHIGPLSLSVFSPNMPGAVASNDPQMISAMKATASTLVELRPPQQILSMFGPTPLLQAFAAVWDAYGVCPRRPAPLRRVKMLSYSPRTTSRSAGIPLSASGPGNVRVARPSDIAALTGLIQLSSPSPTTQQAQKYALHLMRYSQAWVHEVSGGADDANAIASLCEVGRRSSTLATITNLVTTVAFRGQGYAARLLTHVVQCLINSGITSVVLYVPSETPASECIFRRLGFEAVDDTEWIELGYEGVDPAPW